VTRISSTSVLRLSIASCWSEVLNRGYCEHLVPHLCLDLVAESCPGNLEVSSIARQQQPQE
jgi:hypothetical protein